MRLVARIGTTGARLSPEPIDPGEGAMGRLQDVVAAQTSISDIDGKMGRLFYVGYDIHDLAPHATFEEIVFLLHNLRLPNAVELDALGEQLVAEREIVQFIEDLMPTIAHTVSPMSMLRTTVSAMSAHDPDGWDKSLEAAHRKAMRIIARVATVIAYYERVRNGLDLVRPNPKFSHAANLLWMLTGVEPEEDAARVLDTCLVLHADHTMNASTFTPRQRLRSRRSKDRCTVGRTSKS